MNRIPIKNLRVNHVYWYSTNRGNIQFCVLREPKQVNNGWSVLVEYAHGKIADIYRHSDLGDPPIYSTPQYVGVASVEFEMPG